YLHDALPISPSTNSKLLLVEKLSMLCLYPVEKLSKQRTKQPLLKKYSVKLEPIKPAPPVINIFFIRYFIICLFIHFISSSFPLNLFSSQVLKRRKPPLFYFYLTTKNLDV